MWQTYWYLPPMTIYLNRSSSYLWFIFDYLSWISISPEVPGPSHECTIEFFSIYQLISFIYLLFNPMANGANISSRYLPLGFYFSAWESFFRRYFISLLIKWKNKVNVLMMKFKMSCGFVSFLLYIVPWWKYGYSCIQSQCQRVSESGTEPNKKLSFVWLRVKIDWLDDRRKLFRQQYFQLTDSAMESKKDKF